MAKEMTKLDLFALKALPEVMRQYTKMEYPMITYHMDDEHIEHITEGAYNVAKKMMECSKWVNDDMEDE